MAKSFLQEKEIEAAVLMLVDCVRKNCRNPKPLIWHSLKVGCKLYELGESKEIVIAGILHDLLEDTSCKISQIKNKFGPKVTDLVLASTFDARIKDYKERWRKSIAQIKKAGPKAMLIKIIDANNNLSFISLIEDENKLKEVLWKHRLIIDSFKPEMDKSPVFKEYQENIKKTLKDSIIR